MAAQNSSEIEVRLRQLSNWTVTALAIVVVFVISGTGFMLWQAYKVGAQGEHLKVVAIETHEGLCALKGDVRARRDRAAEFLADNPHGIQGINVELIRSSLDNYNATLDALSVITCR